MASVTQNLRSARIIAPTLDEAPGKPNPFDNNSINRLEGLSTAVPGSGPETEAIAEAVIRHLRGDVAGALQSLLTVSTQYRTPDLLAALGYVQSELGQYEAALQTYSELMAQQPEMAEGWFQWGFCLYKLGRSAEALERFEKAATLHSDWIEIPLAEAICHLKMKQYPLALDRAGACLAINASYAPALFTKAVTYHVTWEFDLALDLYKQIVEADPKCIEALMNLVTLGLQQKQDDVVRRYAEQLVLLDPSNVLGIEGIAISSFNAGDYEKSWKQYTRLVDLVPEQVTHWLNLGITCERRDMLPEAVDAYAKARQIRPDSFYAHNYLGGALWKSGDLVGACACYQEAVSRWPEKEELTLTLAQIFEDQGHIERAEEACRNFCALDATRPQVWFRLGYLQFMLTQWNEAADSFQHAVDLKPDWPEAEVNLGLASYKAGRHETAETVLLHLLDRQPENLDGLKVLATVALAQGRTEYALAQHERLLEIGGPDADTYYNCGVLSQSLSQADRAVQFYRDSLAIRPGFAEALLNLGHALKAIGEEDGARSAWIPALELRPEFARGYFRRS